MTWLSIQSRFHTEKNTKLMGTHQKMVGIAINYMFFKCCDSMLLLALWE